MSEADGADTATPTVPSRLPAWAERHPVAAALEHAAPDADLVGTLVGLEPADADAPAVLEAVAAWARVSAWAAAQQARWLAELTRRAPGAEMEFVPAEVGARLAVTRRTAEHLVERAADLERLPALHDALAAGRVDVRKVDVMLHHTAHLSEGTAKEVVAAVLPDAGRLTAPQVGAQVRRVEVRLDPQVADARHRAARAERCVRMVPAPDAMAWIHAFLPATDAQTVMTGVDALAAAAAPEDDRSLPARRADALSDVMRRILDTGVGPHGPLPTAQHRHPHLVVTVNAEHLAALGATAPGSAGGAGNAGGAERAGAAGSAEASGSAGGAGSPSGASSAGSAEASATPVGRRDTELSGAAHLAGYGPVPVSVVREVMAEASWRLTATDPTTGEAVARSSRAYRPSPALAALIVDRDVTCTFVGCRIPATRCDIDHITPFDQANPAQQQTRETNLHALCRHHHRMKTHTPWTPTRDPVTGATLWISRTGGIYTRDPVPTDPDHDRPPPRPPRPTADADPNPHTDTDTGAPGAVDASPDVPRLPPF